MSGTSDFLLLVFIFVILVIVVSIDDYVKKQKKQKSATTSFNSITNFYSRIYWFRDYWSNRNRLNRSQKNEGLGWKDKEDFSVEKLAENEINLQKNENGYFTIRDSNNNKQFKGLVDPHKLIQQYEPLNVIIEMADFGDAPSQLPHEAPFKGDKALGTRIAVRYEKAIDSMHTVFAEKLAVEKEKNYFNTYVTFPFLGVFILVIVATIMRFLINLLPFLNFLYFPIIIIVFALYAWLILEKIIHENTKHVKSAIAFIEIYNGKDPKFHFLVDGDVPNWLDAKPYWVLNYIFEWAGELTVKKGLPPIYFKKDYERIQLWVDSKTGIVEWAVTDYHYRELWYKFEGKIENILVWIFPNFHTPRFLNIRTKNLGELKDLYINGTQLNQIWDSHVTSKFELHPWRWIKSQVGKSAASNIIADSLEKLWWDKWRYPLGADNKDYIYQKGSPVHVVVGKQPTST